MDKSSKALQRPFNAQTKTQTNIVTTNKLQRVNTTNRHKKIKWTLNHPSLIMGASAVGPTTEHSQRLITLLFLPHTDMPRVCRSLTINATRTSQLPRVYHPCVVCPVNELARLHARVSTAERTASGIQQ
jgi:hypothetical protein